MLVWYLGNYQDQLRADFQRYYGLDLDGMGKSYSYVHAAALAANLPGDSAVFRAINPRNGWTVSEYLLHAIEYDLRVLAWQNSKDGAKGRSKPKPLPTPEDEARVRRKLDASNLSYIAEQLNLADKGVKDG